jgi:hypothetical protein
LEVLAKFKEDPTEKKFDFKFTDRSEVIRIYPLGSDKNARVFMTNPFVFFRFESVKGVKFVLKSQFESMEGVEDLGVIKETTFKGRDVVFKEPETFKQF